MNTEMLSYSQALFNSVKNAILEAIPDLHMVSLLELDFLDYLVLIAKTKFKQLYTPNSDFGVKFESDRFPPRLGLRILFVLLGYLKMKNDDQELTAEHLESKLNKWIDTPKYNQADTAVIKIIAAKLSVFFTSVEFLNNDIVALSQSQISNTILKFPDSRKSVSQSYKQLISPREALNLISSFQIDSSAFKKSADSGTEDPIFGKYMGTITSLGDYLNQISIISQKFCLTRNDRLWMRGLPNSTYLNLPSIFREPALEKVTPIELLKTFLNHAYEDTRTESELWVSENVNIKEHVSCLQHYGLPTNLLDFSQDPLIALYFSITPDVESDRKAIDEGIFIPKVIIFDPEKYIKLITRYSEENYLPSINKIHSLYHTRIDRHYFPYIRDLADSDYTKYKEKYNGVKTPPSTENALGKKIHFPAICNIRFSNKRIERQMGTFVAFDLYALKSLGSNGQYNFDYMTLENVQRIIWDKYGRNERNTFLFYLQVSPISVERIRYSLEILGYSKTDIYPALNTIFERIKMRDRNYFSSAKY